MDSCPTSGGLDEFQNAQDLAAYEGYLWLHCIPIYWRPECRNKCVLCHAGAKWRATF
jgi:hypothetical protein